MITSRFLFAAATALLLTSAALADNTPATPATTDGHGMMRGMFTPEERMMLFTDSFKATANMTDDQKHAYRQQQRARIMAMSDADRTKFKADLAARWNALPADQKAAITAKVQAFRAARQAGGGSGQ